MKGLRFRIVWVMLAIAIAALDLEATRGGLESNSHAGEILVLGALPMVNVLAVGLLIGYRRRGSRPFFLGFEAFGAMALVLYVVLASCFRAEVVNPYLVLFFDPIVRIIGQDRPIIYIPIAYSTCVVTLGLPQVAFALMGGFLSHRFRITITGR